MHRCYRLLWIVPLAVILLAWAAEVGTSREDDAGQSDAPAEQQRETTDARVKAGVELSPLTLGSLRSIAAKDDDLTRARKERYNAALAEVTSRHAMFKQGIEPLGSMLEPLERLTKAAESVLEREEYLALLQRSVKLAKGVEESAKARFEGGFAPTSHLHEATFARANLEVRLLEAKREAK